MANNDELRNNLYSFREAFKEYTDCYTVIGGTACFILMDDAAQDFRATDELYYRILEKLQILFDAMEIEKARQYGRAIAKRLSEVETDDDWFPYGDIRRLCEIVDPYGTDEELNRLLEMM